MTNLLDEYTRWHRMTAVWYSGWFGGNNRMRGDMAKVVVTQRHTAVIETIPISRLPRQAATVGIERRIRRSRL